MQNNTLLIAASIIIAGLLIAGGIYLGGNEQNTANTGNNTQNQEAGLQISDQINPAPVTANDHIVGSPDAQLVIVEYSDTECPFCKQFHEIMNDVVASYDENDVAWVYRHFPIAQLHSKAPAEAHATECAAELGGNEGFWNYINRLFEVTPSNDGLDLSRLPEIAEEVGLDRAAFEECQESGRHEDAVQAQLADAREAGGNGTPHNVFVLKEPISDSQLETLRGVFEGARPGSIRLSEDRTKLAVSGGVPLQAVQQLVDILIGVQPSTTSTEQ